jgi:hypothetical protein
MSDRFSVYLDEITDKVVAAIPAAAFKAMEHVRGVAVERTPLESGNLRDEAATLPTDTGARVYYPGPYARYQEYGVSEDGKELRHEVGQSFYLVTAITEETSAVLEILATELRAVIE